MTMGLKVSALLTEKEIKKRAKVRKAESDSILESIYALLMDKKIDQKPSSGPAKKIHE